MGSWTYLSLGQDIDKHSFIFIFWYMVEKFELSKSRRAIPLATGALAFSALELRTVQTQLGSEDRDQ